MKKKKSKGRIFLHNLKVIYKRHKLKNTLILLLILSIIGIVGLTLIYKNGLEPVVKEADNITFTIEQGDTYMSIAPVLKESKLIKSELIYKIYIKLNAPEKLEVGKYSLNGSMGVPKLVDTLNKGTEYGVGSVTFTIPEGWHFEQIAEYGSTVTNNSKNELIQVWDSDEFVNEVINKYWFVTEEVKHPNIRYALEGYLFPATYYFKDEDVKPEDIAYKMLDQTEEILNKYKDKFNTYTVHQILTLASIIEHEAILDEDRKNISSVFYNRLNTDMALQSCATLGYATGQWKLTYTYEDMQIDSPYNTYMYNGLPAGPGNMPSEASIEAALEPNQTNYYYFMANVCDEQATTTYFAETYEQHQANIDRYLVC